ncbi:F0F1 ATP synthase subunit A [Pseudoramibacter faecis]|uniref:F0F1 ATP synthase subunit A n=1 Tax=Pseudoramibacter faecis TaxID=3108534 RepID=UPI003CCA2074
MGNLSKDLQAQLHVATAIRLKLGGVTIGISESVVVTWIIMAVLVGLAIFMTHGLSAEHPGKKQLILESVMGWCHDFFYEILGEDGKRYIPYLTTVLLYLAVSNLIGMAGFKPPTKDLNVTIGLALMSIVLIEYSGWHQKGAKGFFKSFAEPMPIMTPFNILEIGIRPLSLCMRLFGNVLGSFVVMELIKAVCPAVLPIPFNMYFDIFDGLIQAYVFVFLTALFMKEAIA